MRRPSMMVESERLIGVPAVAPRSGAPAAGPGPARSEVERPAAEAADGDPPVDNLGDNLGDQRVDNSPEQPPDYLRCPGCGMLVVLPCVYCRAVAYGLRRRRGMIGGIERRAAA